jgi:hypothetical protein
MIQRAALHGSDAAWLCLWFVTGLVGGLIGAELIGLPLVPLMAILLVLIARSRNIGVPTLLVFCAGFEAVAVWVGLSSPRAPGNPRGRNSHERVGHRAAGVRAAMAGVVFVPFVRRRMWEERERNQSRSQTPI